MQFQTAALALALAVGASAASVDRMVQVVKKAEPKAVVETFNFSTCNPEASAATFELNEVGDCVTFGQGYGAASWTASEDAGAVLGKSIRLSFLPRFVSVLQRCGSARTTRGFVSWVQG